MAETTAPADRVVRWGVIADTHGLLRPEAAAAQQGVERILHAGDVGKPEVLDALRQIAPVEAVRGNVDHGGWADRLPLTHAVEMAPGAWIYLLHDIGALDLDPQAAGFAAVVYGHSHRATVDWRGPVLLLNPGSAGPRRFGLPVGLALLTYEHGRLSADLIEIPG